MADWLDILGGTDSVYPNAGGVAYGRMIRAEREYARYYRDCCKSSPYTDPDILMDDYPGLAVRHRVAVRARAAYDALMGR